MEYIDIGMQLLDIYGLPKKLGGFDRIIIYGAGGVGKLVYSYLKNWLLDEKVDCYFVSKNQDVKTCELPVKVIDDEKVSPNDIVLLAGKRNVRREMRAKCHTLKIMNYLEINVFDDRTYEYYIDLPRVAYRVELEEWYRRRMGRKLNLDNPLTFNEKINWLKLYENDKRKTVLTDKYSVRRWIKEIIGEKYLVELLGKWDLFDDIVFDDLPDSFVLKCNHGCGYNKIIKNKNELNYNELKCLFDNFMSHNYAFVDGFQMHYRDIKPCIIAEEYLENGDGELYDYKFWCFDGKVKFVMFLAERKKHLKMNIYDLEWNLLPFTYNYENTEYVIDKPEKLNEMINIAERLSKGFNHVRVDLYCLNDGRIKFGEMTFSSFTGACEWIPNEMDEKIGYLLNI